MSKQKQTRKLISDLTENLKSKDSLLDGFFSLKLEVTDPLIKSAKAADDAVLLGQIAGGFGYGFTYEYVEGRTAEGWEKQYTTAPDSLTKRELTREIEYQTNKRVLEMTSQWGEGGDALKVVPRRAADPEALRQNIQRKVAAETFEALSQGVLILESPKVEEPDPAHVANLEYIEALKVFRNKMYTPEGRDMVSAVIKTEEDLINA